jgi:hypothetical protein
LTRPGLPDREQRRVGEDEGAQAVLARRRHGAADVTARMKAAISLA